MAGKRGGKGSRKKNSRRRGNNNRGGSNNVNGTNADGGGRQERLKEEEEEEDTTSANIDHQIVEEEDDYDLPAYPDPPPRKQQQQQQQQQQPQQHHQEQQQPLSQQRQGLEPPAGATFVPLSLVMNKRASEASSTVSSIDDPPGDYDTDPHPRSRSRSRSRRRMNGNDNNGNATRPTEYFSDPDQIIVGNNNDHDYHPTNNKRRSRSRNRQIDNDVDDGRVNDNNHWKRTQRGQHDIGIEDDPTSYSYSSEESKHSSYNKYYHPIRQHQEQQQQKQQQRRDSREDPKDWTEDEEGDEEEAEDYLQNQHEQKQLYQQQQKQHQKQEQQHDDHAFTQFNIQPLQQQRQQEQYYSSESRSSQDESEDEEAPLFFGTSNFTTASDTYASHHVKGVGWGVDYLLARAQRKRHEKQQERFEIEERREREEDNRQLWWWQDNNDDSYDEHDFDDVDFDGGYRRHSFVHRHRRGVKNVVLMAVSLVLAIAFFEMGSKTTQNNNPDAANLETESNHHGTAPSSRWGHRFDENRTSTKITAKEKEAELEKWEDYEMEVANVLAETASGGWDIHSKTGNATKDAEEKDGKNKKKNAEEEEGSNNNYANGYHSDGYSDHWVQFYDKSSEAYYYFHRETNATQWEKPAMVKGVALLGIAYGTQREYIIEEGGEVEGTGTGVPVAMGGSGKSVGNDDNKQTTTSISSMEEVQFNRSQKVLDHYAKSYWRWNHPYRIPARTDAWSGIDAPVFWRIPLSGSTTVEEILTHCYHMIVAGTTGSSVDGKAVHSHNISEYLSVLTLDDGAHYLNIDMDTIDGIQKAKHAGLGRSGVADVILTQFFYNAAELFRETSHTGRCFTILRHPVERAIAMFHNLKRNNVTAVSGMSMIQYAKSPIAENNWMTRIITHTMDGALTPQHLQVAKEVIGRKCLVGFLDNMAESMDRFVKFFRWEEIKSINTHHSVVPSKEKDLAGKRKCYANFVKKGVNRHQYVNIPKNHDAWKYLEKKNEFDIELYEYARALYYKQTVVYENNE